MELTGNNRRKEHIIHVHFFEPINGKQDYYFGSLKAIYTQFTHQQIGCRLHKLYGITTDKHKETPQCRISKEVVLRVAQQNKYER